jgi:prepilin-type N-terminal cleavage/methylation domain-containing protein
VPIHQRHSLSAAAGFTLAECLVAITLFSVGLLGLAGTELAVERLAGAGAQRSRAAAIAWSRLEQLRSAPCAARASGSAAANGALERWTSASAGGATIAQDSVTLAAAGGRAPFTFGLETAFPC